MAKITVESEKGPRGYQEDRHYETYIPDSKLQLLAVMDGHGGSEISDFCAKNIFRMISTDPDDPEHKLNALVNNLNSATRNNEAGSTFSGVIISEELKTVSVAILGDSPVVVLDSKCKLHVSPEHNVRTNMEERRATEERGGYYSNGYICVGDRGSQLSRALGNKHLGKVISKEPEIYTIKDPVWVLVASDGLLDPSHQNTEELIEEIGKFAKSKADANTLMDWVKKRGLEDNATAVVWNK